MRKIERLMLGALSAKMDWKLGNTSVTKNGNVFLHGNHIANVIFENGKLKAATNIDTLKRWPSNTTKSRLRALGVSVCKKNGKVYINDRAIGSK